MLPETFHIRLSIQKSSSRRLTKSTRRIRHCRTLLALPRVMLCLSILTSTTRWSSSYEKKRLPKDNPNPKFPSRCVLEALDIGLHGNACQYTDGDGRTLFAKPNHGTEKDLCHTCDYVELTCWAGQGTGLSLSRSAPVVKDSYAAQGETHVFCLE